MSVEQLYWNSLLAEAGYWLLENGFDETVKLRAIARGLTSEQYDDFVDKEQLLGHPS
jgi:hypothetical protein